MSRIITPHRWTAANAIAPVLTAVALSLSTGIQAQQLPTPRIVGGTLVPDAAYPFMASILQVFDNGGLAPFCGGSIISDRWILTAAHCVVDGDTREVASTSSIAVLTNANNLNSEDSDIRTVRNIVVHPDYDPTTTASDIALIELSTTSSSPRLSLPSASSDVPLVNESAIVAGWGTTSFEGDQSFDLLEVTLPVASHASCLPFYDDLDQRIHMCAGGSASGGRDSCQGDSGGPLFVAREGFWVQAGIVSFGQGCALPNIPGVYTRITSFVDWIQGIVPNVNIIDSTPADGNVDTSPTGNASIPVLTAADPERSGFVARGEISLYEVTGAERADLTTDSGDADLTIVRGTTFDVESIICNSQLVTELDSCSLPDTSERLFAIVFGFEDSDYAIRVGNGSTIVFPIDNGTIADDDPIANADAASTGGSGGGGALGILGLIALAGAGLSRKKNRR